MSSTLTETPTSSVSLAQPRIERRPDAVGTHGPKARRFGEAAGVRLDPWQSYIVDRLFDYNDAGEWAATEAALLAARQNGKGEILVVYDLAHLFLFPRKDKRRKTILHSAHQFKTAIDGFDRLRGVVEASPRLMAKVEHIYTGAGMQEIILKRRKGQVSLGDRIKFVARSKSSGRGFAADVIVYDEAQELSATARDALTYTQSTIWNRQEFYCGTVPDEDENEYEVFEGIRDRGREPDKALYPRTYWAEYSPTGSEDPDLALDIDITDEHVWGQANPAKDIRIRTEVIQEQHDRDTSAAKESFRRERLSIWPARRPEEQLSANDIDLAAWHGEETSRRMHGTPLVLALAVADSGGYASISAVSRISETQTYAEHLHTAVQTRWVPGKVKALMAEMGADSLVLDERKAAPILNDLKREKIKYLAMKPAEIAAATAMVIEYINDGSIAHRGQEELTTSLRYAQPRTIGAYGYTWEQSDESEPVTQAQSVTLAHWGVHNYEANPPKRVATRGYGG